MPLAQPARPMSRGRPPRSSLPHGRRAESFADDLNTRRGIVSGRVALLPRSTEIQPHVARIRPSPLNTPLPSGSPNTRTSTLSRNDAQGYDSKSMENEQNFVVSMIYLLSMDGGTSLFIKLRLTITWCDTFSTTCAPPCNSIWHGNIMLVMAPMEHNVIP